MYYLLLMLYFAGLLFRDLYSKCREQFLVSSDLALRAQLTEFLDHKLVKMKRTLDGSENLVIPIENVLLQQFLEQQESWQSYLKPFTHRISCSVNMNTNKILFVLSICIFFITKYLTSLQNNTFRFNFAVIKTLNETKK